MPDPVTDLTLTQNAPGDSLGTLTWAHTGVDLDRFMLGYKRGQDTEWTNLAPRPKAEFGAGPYEATVPLTEDIEWRAVAVDAAGEVSA